MKKLPDEITVCELECILLPNGDVIFAGKELGRFNDFKKYLTVKPEEEEEVDGE